MGDRINLRIGGDRKIKVLKHFLKLWVVGLAAGILLIDLTGCGKKKEDEERKHEKVATVQTEKVELSEEVCQVLERKIELVERLAEEPLIIKSVRESNKKNRTMTHDEILKRDDMWKFTEGIDDFIKTFITNECAQFLIDFQESNEEFPEIFVTDEKGLIVAETNKTSDYYQADEGWWIKAYNQGNGMSHHGEIEYDESVYAEVIGLYAPVIEPETQKAIGVIKAVCDITAIKLEL